MFSTDRLLPLFVAGLALLVGPVLAQPQPESTRVVVRAASNDAKLLHDGVGGALIRIVNTETGEVLAEGVQRGTSGNTEQIMRQPRERGAAVYDTPDAAKFETTLMLARPTTVTVTALGPRDYPQAQKRTSTTMTLMPGEHMTGNGIVLPLHGFIVEVLRPTTSSAAPGETIDVRARVRMMCGCPTEPGGLWDASRYTIQAKLVGPDGGVVATAPLSYTGTTSEYEGTITVPSEGATQLRVTSVDAERANAGAATMPLSMVSQ
ncbi:MAG: hypothetical protein V5A58_13855 [Salinibacter sp.]|uniref:hypothetical protein n=1 Tax=Salinibacter sp. TaxID=2065818 RepID=UPI002FC30E84